MGLEEVPTKNLKDEIKQEVAEYLEDTVLDYVSQGKSPVDGKPFKGLKKEYKKIKSKISGSSRANLELHGDMLDDFDVRVSGNSLTIGIHKDASEQSKLKAERHNHWTKRAKTIGKGKAYPKRQFIPKGEQGFTKEIMQDIREIITGKLEERQAEADTKTQQEWLDEAKKHEEKAVKLKSEIDKLKEKAGNVEQKKTKVSKKEVKVLKEKLTDIRKKKADAEKEIKLRKENIKKLKLKLKESKKK